MIPQGDRIQIEVEKKDKTSSGIVINQDNIIGEVGIIKELSPELEFTHRQFKVGQRVMFKSWSLDIVEVDDKEFVFIDADDILAIL